MKLLGLKLARLKQWRELLVEELREEETLPILWHIFKTVLSFRTSSRNLWRARMRTCPKCPIYDKALRRCRPYTGSPLGCGCAVWLLALIRKNNCWAKENLPDEGLGWVD